MKNAILLFTGSIMLAWSGQIALGEQTATLAIAEIQTTPVLVEKCSAQEPGAPSVSSLEEILEATDNQMNDWLQTMGMFNVLAGNDLRKVAGRGPKEEVVETPVAIVPVPAQLPKVIRPTKLVGTMTSPKGVSRPVTFSRVESPAESSPESVVKDLPPGSPDLQGRWTGGSTNNVHHLVLQIIGNADATYGGTVYNVEAGKTGNITVEYTAPFLKIKFPKGAQYPGGAQFVAELKPEPVAVPKPPVSQRKLRKPDAYDLKDPGTIEQFKQAGIKYFLLLTLEDFNDQTLDLMKGQADLGYLNSQSSVTITSAQQRVDISRESSVQRRAGKRKAQGSATIIRAPERMDVSGASSVQGGVVKLESNVRKEQTVRLSVSYRIYDVESGALLETQRRSFATNRIYTALAQGENARSTGDIYQAAAHDVAEWVAIRAGEVAFPIRVLEKNNDEVTINRGTDSGIRVGQVYGVYTLGKELKDPGTGEVLGREEVTVGKVTVTELHPKFSKAKIWNDTTVDPGSTLRLVSGK